MLPSEIPRFSTDPPVRVFPGVWKLLSFLRLPYRKSSVPTSFVSLFIFSILSYLLLKTIGCLSGCLMSSASIQKLFCGIYSAFKCSFNEFFGEKVVSRSYSSTILGPPSNLILPAPFFFLTYLSHHINSLCIICVRKMQIFPICIFPPNIKVLKS